MTINCFLVLFHFVFSYGACVLSLLSHLLLIAFGGVTVPSELVFLCNVN